MTDKDLAKIDDIEKLALISAHAGGIDMPKPFEREIYLFDTHVAGTTHIEKIKSIGPLLKIGDKVNFYREPTNPHDPQAIRIETTGYQKNRLRPPGRQRRLRPPHGRRQKSLRQNHLQRVARRLA